MKKKAKLIIAIFTSCIAVLVIAIAIVNYKFGQLSPNMIYSDCFKVWGHRGNFQKHEPNSIASFERAFELGAKGTELDIFYDLDMDDYIVSHDYPYKLKNGRILKLEEVFSKIAKRGYFWLDFKNLTKLSKTNAEKANDQASSIGRKIRNKKQSYS